MLNKIFKSGLIGAFVIFALTLNSCKKPEDTKAIITVVDINGTVVKDAKVRLHQDGQISPSGQYSEVSDEQWTDASGQTEHVFEYEATLNVAVWKKMGTDTLTGNNVIRLLKQKTVSKTIEID
ncbi:uncharacterized protein METZ01_LOCUS478890 [marine metagenome]|uniref:Uncharacterized protein n=1 Tax=marine metagenome TaxID=408172 RepID=A0A383C0R0_9ZZZZ